MKKIIIINGPNLNLLGNRETDIYGKITLAEIERLSKNKANEKINVYLNVFSGEILAIRSAQWRVWDLMWGFHIIDWQERDNINNFLLKMFSILALISSLTGLLLFFKVDIKK